MLIIGSHVGLKKDTQLLGALNETLSYNGNAFMFYTGAPQNTVRMPLNDDLTFKALEKMKENNISLDNVVVHAPYIINLANNKDLDKYNFSINFLKQECNRCADLFVKKLVLHPGSHVGCGNDIGINNIINALNEVLKEILIKKIDRVNQTEDWKNRYSTKLFCTRYSNLINIKK